MATASGGGLGRRRTKDAARASYMATHGIFRTTQRCPVCYRITTAETYKTKYSSGSRYNHVCKGGK